MENSELDDILTPLDKRRHKESGDNMNPLDGRRRRPLITALNKSNVAQETKQLITNLRQLSVTEGRLSTSRSRSKPQAQAKSKLEELPGVSHCFSGYVPEVSHGALPQASPRNSSTRRSSTRRTSEQWTIKEDGQQEKWHERQVSEPVRQQEWYERQVSEPTARTEHCKATVARLRVIGPSSIGELSGTDTTRNRTTSKSSTIEFPEIFTPRRSSLVELPDIVAPKSSSKERRVSTGLPTPLPLNNRRFSFEKVETEADDLFFRQIVRTFQQS